MAMLLSYDTIRFPAAGQQPQLVIRAMIIMPRSIPGTSASDRIARRRLLNYKLVIVGALYRRGELAEKLMAYVEKGGAVIFTARSGVKDEFNTVVNMPLPGLLAELCGIEVEEYDSLPDSVTIR
jgi:beta-galactosidase GanA